MKHIRFEIIGHKSLAARGIHSIVMEPQERLQMILGSNGSGKSTLMKQLSLLSADHKSFNKPGRQFDVVEFKGSVYTGLSEFTETGNHYCLTKDDKVIYEGHVASAYNDYVKEYLNVTPQIHDLSIGKIRFTSMDVAARRNWITSLSPQDYTYAIAYFNRLSESHRDITGSIKRLNDKFNIEKSKLLSEDDQRKLQAKSTQLRQTKDKMLLDWRPMDVTFEEAIDQVDKYDQSLLELAVGLRASIRTYCRHEGFHTEEQVQTELTKAKADVYYHDKVLEKIFTDLEENNELIRQSVSVGDKDLKSIDASLFDLRASMARLKASKRLDHHYADAKISKDVLDGNFPEIIRLFNEIVSDPEDNTTIANTQSLKLSISDYERLERQYQSEILAANEIVRAMEHRKSEGHTQCPKCQFVWFQGYDENTLNQAKQKISGLEKTIKALNDNIAKTTEIVEFSVRQIQLYQQVGVICRSTDSHLAPMWNLLMEGKMFKKNTAKAIEIVQSTLNDLQTQSEIDAIDKDVQELEKLRAIAVATGDLNRSELQSKNELLEKQLFFVNRDKAASQRWVNRLEDMRVALQFQNKYEDKATDIVERRLDALKKAEILLEQSVVSNILANLEKEITDIERELGSCLSQVALVNSYQEQITELTEKEKLLKYAIKELSPKEGLIAKGLTGFINHFIAQMNAVIAKVWLYPLSINPIELDPESPLKLNYKFSFSVDGKRAGLDVEDGSGAQKEIFDLAFMLVSMKHLKLDTYPVFLDEFSVKMDYAHRREAMKMIMELLNTSSFSQIFMVSHYENSYGNLTNADITVLCPENIEIPPDLVYNKVSEIKR